MNEGIEGVKKEGMEMGAHLDAGVVGLEMAELLGVIIGLQDSRGAEMRWRHGDELAAGGRGGRLAGEAEMIPTRQARRGDERGGDEVAAELWKDGRGWNNGTAAELYEMDSGAE